jgi:hypothetical protein
MDFIPERVLAAPVLALDDVTVCEVSCRLGMWPAAAVLQACGEFQTCRSPNVVLQLAYTELPPPDVP